MSHGSFAPRRSRTLWRSGAALAGALLLPASGLGAGEPVPLRPALRVYGIPDGLKYPQTFSLLQDRRGHLWIGTSYGLSRYDGRRFSTLTRRQGLPHDSVRELAEDASGRIWALTEAGPACVEPAGGARGEPRLLPVPDGLSEARRVAAVRGDPERGVVWFTTRERLYALRDGLLRTVPLPPEVSLRRSRLIAADPASVWLVTPEAALRATEAGVLERQAPPPELGALALVAGTPEDPVLVGMRGVATRSGEAFVADPARAFPPGVRPVGAAALPDGTLAVATLDSGLLLFSRGRPPRIVTAAEGLPASALNAVLVDRDGLLWLGTEDGLVKVFDLAIASYPAQELGGVVYVAVPDGAGGHLVGHAGGLSRLRDGRFSPISPSWPAGAAVWSILVLGPEELLAASTQGLLHVRSGRVRALTEIPGLAALPAFDVVRGGDGRVYASGMGFLARFDWRDGRAREPLLLSEGEGRPLGEVRAISVRPDGRLAAGTDGGGVLVWDGGPLRRVGRAEGLPGLTCRPVLHVGERLWVGTDSGLYELAGDGRARPLSLLNAGLDDPYVTSLARGPDGAVWLATTYSVYRIENQVLTSRLSRSDGLAGHSTSGERCVGLSPEGQLLVGMAGGLSIVDVPVRRATAPAPAVGISTAWDGEGREVVEGSVVPWRARAVSFLYESPTFLAEESTLFSERLVGLEGEASPPHREAAQRYAPLPPGRYTLEVMALSAAGRRSPRPARLSFQIAPAWWGTAPARGAAALALAGLVLGVVRLRTRRLSRRAARLEEKVAERTQALREANERLAAAQRRIAELMESAVTAQEDVGRWASEEARQIAGVIHASGVSVFRVEDGAAHPIASGETPVPSEEELLQAVSGVVPRAGGSGFLVPVRGAAGQLLGVVSAEGKRELGDEERLLLVGFAHELGGALEIGHMRKKLLAAESIRAAVVSEMEERGEALAAVCARCGRCVAAREGATCPEDGDTVHAERLLPLRVRQRYELERVLGEGGMGTVFLARDVRLPREVAVKIVRPEHLQDPAARTRLSREANAIARIRHPGVVSLFDSGELPDGSVYLVMERLLGRDLASLLLESGRGRPEQVASLVVQAASALAAAHRAGVVHRDVKPANLFLEPGGTAGFRVTLVDFGLAKSSGPEEGLTRTGTIVGTPAYMSPEQVSGRAAAEASDLYSLAAVTFEALTGRRLVVAETIGEIFSEIVSGAPAPASRYRAGITPAVDRLLLAALAREPERRPEELVVWADALAAALAAVPSDEEGWPLSRQAA